MKTLFESGDRESLLGRLDALKPDSQRQWGKMNSAQALCHCAIALEAVTGIRPIKQKLIGKILMPFFKKSILGEQPCSRNYQTDPSCVVADERNFTAEQAYLQVLIEQYV